MEASVAVGQHLSPSVEFVRLSYCFLSPFQRFYYQVKHEVSLSLFGARFVLLCVLVCISNSLLMLALASPETKKLNFKSGKYSHIRSVLLALPPLSPADSHSSWCSFFALLLSLKMRPDSNLAFQVKKQILSLSLLLCFSLLLNHLYLEQIIPDLHY